MSSLRESPGLQVYLAGASHEDAAYTAGLAALSGFSALDLKEVVPLARWDEGLSVLFNSFGHRHILCTTGQVPDLDPGDLHRALMKLDLYEMIIGREGEDRYWLIGMDGYHELLRGAAVQPVDFLHPILHSASQAGLNVSVLDTKYAFTGGEDLSHLQSLAGRPRHDNLTRVLAGLGLHPVQAAAARLPQEPISQRAAVCRTTAVSTGTPQADLVHLQTDEDAWEGAVKEGKGT